MVIIYDIIGKVIVYSTWIAVILVLFSLFFGYIALKRRILFYSFFANILDFFYMPLKAIYAYFGNGNKLDTLMVQLKNKANWKKYKKTRKRIFLATHCMRALDCPAKSTRQGIKCISCGRCPYSNIKKKSEELGMKLFILTGSSAVKYVIRTEKFGGILLLACNYELNKVMRSFSYQNCPVYGVPLTNDGCYNTKTNLNQLYYCMKAGL